MKLSRLRRDAGQGPQAIDHVGSYVGNGQMIDAPHTGADVRVESTPTTPGATWGTAVVVGVTTVEGT